MSANLCLPPPDSPEFPAALAAARKAAGISAAELARRAGISPTMVARYESTTRKDHHRPRAHIVTRLEQALRDAGVPVNGSTPVNSSTVAPALSDATLDALIAELERRGYGVTITKAAPR